MPNISINKNDLKDLGIDLKDILRAITKTKADEIKIKKIKKSKKIKKKLKKNVKQVYNPFPDSNQPRYPQYSSGGGGGSHGPIITITNPTNPTDKDDKVDKLNENLDKKLNQLESQQSTTSNRLLQAGYALRYIMNNQNNPPPLTYAYQSNSLNRNRQSQSPVDFNDGNGIVGTNNFYDTANTFVDTSNDINNSNTFDDQDTSIEETEKLVQSPQKFKDIDLTGPDSDEEDYVYPIEEKQEIKSEPMNVFDLLKQDIADAEKKKKGGRPKGSKNKPKQHPLSTESISKEYNTRTSGQTLMNPNFQTPDQFLKRQSESKLKQESIESMFKKSSQLPTTTPIVEEKDDDDEDETNKPVVFKKPRMPNRMPTPPSQPKPSGIKKPTKRRTKSAGDPIELG